MAGGTTVLLTTQYLDEADQLADEIVVIDAGQVIAHGTAAELKTRIGGDRLEVVVRDPEELAAAAAAVRRATGNQPQVAAAARRISVPVRGGSADLLTCAVGILIMAIIGLLVGWRAHHGLPSTLAAFGLILLLRYAVSWIGVWVGLSVTPQTADSLVPLVFPVTMVSNSFVPTTGMPAWVRLVADWNPVSALVAACRDLFGNPTILTAHASLPLRHPVATTIGWSLLLLLVFVPLSARRHQSAGR